MKVIQKYPERVKIMAKADELALQFHQTKDNKIFDKFASNIDGILREHIAKRLAGSNFDPQELYSILLIDLWRLLKVWEPVENKKFHWLMLRQLQNKTITFVTKNSKSKKMKKCPCCSYAHERSQLTCDNCGTTMSLYITPLREADMPAVRNPKYSGSKTMSASDIPSSKASFVDAIEAKDIVDKLMDKITDQKTKKLLTLILDGEEAHKVLSELTAGTHPGSYHYRMKKCRQIIEDLCKEKGIENVKLH